MRDYVTTCPVHGPQHYDDDGRCPHCVRERMLAEALEPFAAIAEVLTEAYTRDKPVWGFNGADLLGVDFTKARAALDAHREVYGK